MITSAAVIVSIILLFVIEYLLENLLNFFQLDFWIFVAVSINLFFFVELCLYFYAFEYKWVLS